MRKNNTFTYNDRGVDKTFEVTEMSAMDTQDFLIDGVRLVLSTGLLDKFADTDIDTLRGSFLSDAVNAIQQTLFANGFRLSKLSNLDKDLLADLRLRLLACCSYKLNKLSIKLDTREKVDMYIEDQKTLFMLQKEAFFMAIGFLKQDVLPTSQEAPSAETQAASTSKPLISRLS